MQACVRLPALLISRFVRLCTPQMRFAPFVCLASGSNKSCPVRTFFFSTLRNSVSLYFHRTTYNSAECRALCTRGVMKHVRAARETNRPRVQMGRRWHRERTYTYIVVLCVRQPPTRAFAKVCMLRMYCTCCWSSCLRIGFCARCCTASASSGEHICLFVVGFAPHCSDALLHFLTCMNVLGVCAMRCGDFTVV